MKILLQFIVYAFLSLACFAQDIKTIDFQNVTMPSSLISNVEGTKIIEIKQFGNYLLVFRRLTSYKADLVIVQYLNTELMKIENEWRVDIKNYSVAILDSCFYTISNNKSNVYYYSDMNRPLILDFEIIYFDDIEKTLIGKKGTRDIFLYDLATEKKLWNNKMKSEIEFSMAVDIGNNKIALYSDNGFGVFDLNKGLLVSKKLRTSYREKATLTLQNEKWIQSVNINKHKGLHSNIYYNGEYTLYASINELMCFDTLGNSKWSTHLDEYYATQSKVFVNNGNGYLFYTGNENVAGYQINDGLCYIICFDVKTGKKLFKRMFYENERLVDFFIQDDFLYLLSHKNYKIFDLKTGNILLTKELDNYNSVRPLYWVKQDVFSVLNNKIRLSETGRLAYLNSNLDVVCLDANFKQYRTIDRKENCVLEKNVGENNAVYRNKDALLITSSNNVNCIYKFASDIFEFQGYSIVSAKNILYKLYNNR